MGSGDNEYRLLIPASLKSVGGNKHVYNLWKKKKKTEKGDALENETE